MLSSQLTQVRAVKQHIQLWQKANVRKLSELESKNKKATTAGHYGQQLVIFFFLL